MNKKQKANLIGAGTVTGSLLMFGLIFGGVGAKDTAVTDPINNNTTIIEEGTDPTVEELQNALQIMKNREAEYAAQIEQANQLLAEQANQANYSDYDDDDEYEEHEEHEREEHEEHEEHEEYEDD